MVCLLSATSRNNCSFSDWLPRWLQMREKLSPKGQEQQREANAFDAFL